MTVHDASGCEFAHDDAAYVLGALPPAERLAFERHLATCAECERSVRQIAGLPGLLGRVPLDVVEDAPPAEPLPETLLPALLHEVRRDQRRRRWTVGLVAAAAVAAIGAVALTGIIRDDGPQQTPPSAAPTTAPSQQMTPVGASGDEASVALTPVAWGTRLDLVCTWTGGAEEPGYPAGDHSATYALVVRSRSGAVEQVATWKGLPGKTMKVSGATALPRQDIAAVEIRTADGRPAFELAG